MAASDHSEKFKEKVVNDAVRKYEKLIEDDRNGVRKLYRNKCEIIESRIRNKTKRSKSGWFTSRGNTAILRVQYTPSSILASRIRKRIQSDPDLRDMGVLVSEKNGTQIKSVANFVEPHKEDYCSRHDCFVCKSADKPTFGNCWREGVSYSISCRRSPSSRSLEGSLILIFGKLSSLSNIAFSTTSGAP